MHNNYYLIRQVVKELKSRIIGFEVIDCFSQNKDELIIQLYDGSLEFVLQAHLTNKLSCLAFPDKYPKAKKNTASIFKVIYGLKITDIYGFTNERAFCIDFEGGFSLLFKLFGRQSNILLLKENQVISLFKDNLKNDFHLDIETLEHDIDQSEQAIINNLSSLKLIYPILDKPTLAIIENNIKHLGNEEAVETVQNFIKQLENPSAFYIINYGDNIRLNLIPEGDLIYKSSSALEALTYFFKIYHQEYSLSNTKNSLQKDFEQKIKKTRAYINKTRKKQDELLNNTSYQEQADMLMANLHLIKPNTSSIALPDFSNGDIINIRLNPRLNGQLNAAKYYKKAKNVSIEIKNLEEIIFSKEQHLKELVNNLNEVQEANTIAGLKKFTKINKLEKNKSKSLFKTFNIDGFTIWVGKNAKQNDELTLKHAKKNDLFFHAKDVSGSHVILKQISGKPIPRFVLEKVAALAAYYSKRKTDSLCAVGYTPKKYVRKPKGASPGRVLVEREKVILVQPGLP